jgi:uncharacterized lipoprotein YddW (UPF0748 family)
MSAVDRLLFLCPLIASLQAFAAAPKELRGVWVDRAPLESRASIGAMLDQLQDAHFNAVFVNVWSRGYPLWRSQVFERETGVPTDPVYGERDVLAEVLAEASRRGIAVIPWVEYGFVIGYSGGKAPLVEKHPEWLAKRKNGTTDFSWAGTTRSFWIAHANPEGQQFLFELMEELAREYDVPAIQFDRARYPELDCGYDDATRALYAKEHAGAELPANERDAAWMRWRADKLNVFVAELARRVKAVNWRLLFTNAPIVYSFSYVNFLQEYPVWMKDRSHDFVSPQVYRNDFGAFERELDNQIRALEGNVSRLVPGIDITNATVETLIRQIELCRRRELSGVVIWFFGGLVAKDALPRLKQTVFSEPAALPWK